MLKLVEETRSPARAAYRGATAYVVALVMIVTTRFVRAFAAQWGIAGSVTRGMAMLLLGAVLLAVGQMSESPSFVTFVLPMWIVAMGIVLTVSVTANGALQEFGDVAGMAVALYFCIQSLVVGIVGTLFVILFDGDTAWPLVAYCTALPTVTSGALWILRRQLAGKI